MIDFNQTLIRNGGGFLFPTDSGDRGSGGFSFATYDTCRTNFPGGFVDFDSGFCVSIMWITLSCLLKYMCYICIVVINQQHINMSKGKVKFYLNGEQKEKLEKFEIIEEGVYRSKEGCMNTDEVFVTELIRIMIKVDIITRYYHKTEGTIVFNDNDEMEVTYRGCDDTNEEWVEHERR